GLDGVGTAAALERVVPDAADDGVGAGASVGGGADLGQRELVVAVAALDLRLLRGAGRDGVVPVTAARPPAVAVAEVDGVVARAGIDVVAPALSEDPIVPRAAEDRLGGAAIEAAAELDGVVARAGVDVGVTSPVAVDEVVTIAAAQHEADP